MTQKKFDEPKGRPYNSLISGESLINTLKTKDEEIQPKRQPLRKPTQDKAAENRSQSINTEDLSRRSSQSINYYNKTNNAAYNEGKNSQLQRYKYHLESNQSQIKNLGKLLGNQNMSIQEMKNALEGLLRRQNQKNIQQRLKWKQEQIQQNQISRQYLKSIEGDFLRKSKILQQIASSVNLEPGNASYLKNQNEQYQNMKLQHSNSSQNIRDELIKKAKYIQELNREIQKQKLKYDSLNQSYQAFKQQAKQNNPIIYLGVAKTPEELINQLNLRDELIISKTDRIYELEDQIRQLKQTIYRLQQQNNQLRHYLINGTHKQVNFQSLEKKVFELNQEKPRLSLGKSQKQAIQENKEKKSLFNQEAVVSQNIVEYQSDKNFVNISKSSLTSKQPDQYRSIVNKRQSLNNVNLLKSSQKIQKINSQQHISLQIVKSNRSNNSSAQPKQIDLLKNKSGHQFQKSQIPIINVALPDTNSERLSRLQYEKSRNVISQNNIQGNKIIISSIFDKAKSLDQEVNLYWEHVNDMHNRTVDQYEQKMQQLKKQVKMLEIQKEISHKNISEIKNSKSAQVLYAQANNQSYVQNLHFLQKQVLNSKQEFQKVKIQLIQQSQQIKRQKENFHQTLQQLSMNLQEEKKEKQAKQEQKKRIENQNKFLKEKLQELKQEKIKEVNSYRISLSNKINEVSKQKEESQRQTKELERKMRQEQQRISLLQNQYNTIKQQYEKLSIQVQKTQKNSQSLISQNQYRYRSLEQELQEAKKTIQVLRRLIQEKQTIINQINQDYSRQADQLRESLRNAQLQILHYNKSLNSLSSEYQYYKSTKENENLQQLQQLNYHKIEANKLRNQIKQNEQISSELTTKLLNWQHEFNKLQQQNKSLVSNLTSMSGLLDKKNNETLVMYQKQKLLSSENQRLSKERFSINQQIRQKVLQFEEVRNGIIHIFKDNAVLNGNPFEFYKKMGLQLGNLLNIELIQPNSFKNQNISQKNYPISKQRIQEQLESQTSFAKRSSNLNKNSINQSSFGEGRQAQFQQPQQIIIKSKKEQQIRNSQIISKAESNNIQKKPIGSPNQLPYNHSQIPRNTISIERILSNPQDIKPSIPRNNSQKVIIKREQRVPQTINQNRNNLEIRINDYGQQIVNKDVNNSKDQPNRNKSADQRNLYQSNPIYNTTPHVQSNKIENHMNTNATSRNNQRNSYSPSIQHTPITNTPLPFGFSHILVDNLKKQQQNVFSGININKGDYYGNQHEQRSNNNKQELNRQRISKGSFENVVFNRTSQRKSNGINLDQLSESNRHFAEAKNRLSESQQSGLLLNQNSLGKGGCCMNL